MRIALFFLGLCVAATVPYFVTWPGRLFVQELAEAARAHAGPISIFICAALSIVLVSIVVVKDGERPKELGFPFVLLLIGVAIAFGAAVIIYRDELGMAANACAIVFTGALATIGWLRTNDVTSFNAKQAHTNTVILQFRSNQLLQKHRENLFRKGGYDVPLTPRELDRFYDELSASDAWDNPDAPPFIDSLRFILNFYETIAYGVRSDDLNYFTVYQTVSAIITATYNRYEAFILEENARDPAAYVNLIWLVRRIKQDDERRLYERVV